MHGRSIGGIAACRLERPVMAMGWSNWFGSWWRNQVPLSHHQSGTLHPPFNGFHGIYIIGHKTQKINFDLLYYIPTINPYLLFFGWLWQIKSFANEFHLKTKCQFFVLAVLVGSIPSQLHGTIYMVPKFAHGKSTCCFFDSRSWGWIPPFPTFTMLAIHLITWEPLGAS